MQTEDRSGRPFLPNAKKMQRIILDVAETGRDGTELLKLIPFLEQMAQEEDVRPSIRQQFNLHELVYGERHPDSR